MRTRNVTAIALVAAGLMVLIGCHTTPWTDYDRSTSPAPLRMPAPDSGACADSYEDSLTGGQVFAMYCAQCHNARPLAERPFSNYKNVAAHMRVRANLTGKEYAKLVAFLREVQDVPSPTPPDEPSPKRFIFSQPIAELRDKAPATPPERLPQPDKE
jgi:hypothetical protein